MLSTQRKASAEISTFREHFPHTQRQDMKTTTCSIIFASVLFFLSPAFAQFTPWSENVFAYVKKEYGDKAEKRLHYLHDLVRDNQDKPVLEKLDLVNDTLNHLPWIADKEHWNSVDYWATPLETITTFGGDCEDIAIAKWITLNHLGIPNKNLRLAYVKIIKTNESHMVLLYIENPDDALAKQRVRVLDNYTDGVKMARDRRDLLAVFVTDAKGNVILYKDDGQKRTAINAFKEKKIKNLESLKKKIMENRQKYQELNDGHPLLPQD